LAISLSLVGSANVWADYPTIHVTWADSPGPVESRDYVICDSSPCDPDLPSIELITSSLTWQIWSTDPDNTGGIGDIGTITCP
jgi:hypothetical protein